MARQLRSKKSASPIVGRLASSSFPSLRRRSTMPLRGLGYEGARLALTKGKIINLRSGAKISLTPQNRQPKNDSKQKAVDPGHRESDSGKPQKNQKQNQPKVPEEVPHLASSSESEDDDDDDESEKDSVDSTTIFPSRSRRRQGGITVQIAKEYSKDDGDESEPHHSVSVADPMPRKEVSPPCRISPECTPMSPLGDTDLDGPPNEDIPILEPLHKRLRRSDRTATVERRTMSITTNFQHILFLEPTLKRQAARRNEKEREHRRRQRIDATRAATEAAAAAALHQQEQLETPPIGTQQEGHDQLEASLGTFENLDSSVARPEHDDHTPDFDANISPLVGETDSSKEILSDAISEGYHGEDVDGMDGPSNEHTSSPERSNLTMSELHENLSYTKSSAAPNVDRISGVHRSKKPRNDRRVQFNTRSPRIGIPVSDRNSMPIHHRAETDIPNDHRAKRKLAQQATNDRNRDVGRHNLSARDLFRSSVRYHALGPRRRIFDDAIGVEARIDDLLLASHRIPTLRRLELATQLAHKRDQIYRSSLSARDFFPSSTRYHTLGLGGGVFDDLIGIDTHHMDDHLLHAECTRRRMELAAAQQIVNDRNQIYRNRLSARELFPSSADYHPLGLGRGIFVDLIGVDTRIDDLLLRSDHHKPTWRNLGLDLWGDTAGTHSSVTHRLVGSTPPHIDPLARGHAFKSSRNIPPNQDRFEHPGRSGVGTNLGKEMRSTKVGGRPKLGTPSSSSSSIPTSSTDPHPGGRKQRVSITEGISGRRLNNNSRDVILSDAILTGSANSRYLEFARLQSLKSMTTTNPARHMMPSVW